MSVLPIGDATTQPTRDVAEPSISIRRLSPFDQPTTKFQTSEVKPRSLERQHLTLEELCVFFKSIQKVTQASGDWGFWYPYFYIQYFFGCRISEPALIRDKDVDFRRGTILIRRLKKAQEIDGYMEHRYEMSPGVIECARRVLQWKALGNFKNPFLFPSNRSRGTASVGAERLSKLRNLDGLQAVSRFTATRAFDRIALWARLPVFLQHSHVLRYSRPVVLLALDSPLEQVEDLCGHRSIKATMNYLDASGELRDSMTPESVADIQSMGLG